VVEENKFKLTVKGCDLTIDLPEETFYVEGIQIAKRGIAMDIQKFLPELAETKFVETFKAEPKPAPATAAVPAPEAPAVPEAEKEPEAKPAETKLAKAPKAAAKAAKP
jgi:hypothetical protein